MGITIEYCDAHQRVRKVNNSGEDGKWFEGEKTIATAKKTKNINLIPKKCDRCAIGKIRMIKDWKEPEDHHSSPYLRRYYGHLQEIKIEEIKQGKLGK